MIRFACSNCSHLISVAQKYSGRKGKCPKCGNAVTVPDESTIIKFACASCGHKIRVPERQAGKRGACPECKNPVIVPAPRKGPSINKSTKTIICSMCDNRIEISNDAEDEFAECTQCGSCVETASADGLLDTSEPDASVSYSADGDVYEEEAEDYEASAGPDRRLVLLISGGALVVVLVVILLAVVLRPTKGPEVSTEIQESSVEQQIESAQQFAEQYIDLLEQGEVDQARQYLHSNLEGELHQAQVKRLADQINTNRPTDRECVHSRRQSQPQGECLVLQYTLHGDEGEQTIVISMLQADDDFRINAIAARDHMGRTATVGATSFAALSHVSTVAARQVPRPSGRKVFFAVLGGLAIGTALSAACLWVGMKITSVDGTFITALGIAAISSLAGVLPLFIIPMPCVGSLVSLIVMFVLICKWTDARFFPDAVGIVLIAGVVGSIGSHLLNFLA